MSLLDLNALNDLPKVERILALAETIAKLEKLDAEGRVAWALENLPGEYALSSSFGIQAAVSLHLVNTIRPDIPVILTDTGYLFPETYQFIDELAEKLKLPKAGTAKLHAMGGSAEVRLVTIAKVQVSTNISKWVDAAALPARYVGADGLLGIDSLKGQRIVMDFPSNTMRIEPASGVSWPVIIRNSVDLPAPLGPMTPTMPPGRTAARILARNAAGSMRGYLYLALSQ